MPALDIDDAGVPDVASFGALLTDLLREAEAVKQVTTIEPALQKSQFHDLSQRVTACFARSGATAETEATEGSLAVAKTRRNAIVETAARSLFDRLIASTPIDSPDFVQMWNFLDILSILSDDEQCDPALIWWLLEELLDSQTIAGCRIIFDYLESRHERLTGKHFKQKNLIILRSCNELLRRLSRAEDTAFCGRVFIFLFQSFPLGDRSSVNLRGEFHVENVTNYEKTSADQADSMDVDAQPEAEKTDEAKGSTPAKEAEKDKPTDMDALYPAFWSLQEDFSQPLRLFEPGNLTKFKDNLSASVKAFKKYPGDEGNRYSAVDDTKRDLKRKREEDGTDAANAFNPKYLTSRDLFELEISDLSFRRHILVQALILLDFLLSLSAAAKEKYATLAPTNRAVLYSSELSEDDTKWAKDMKHGISEYLRPSSEGQYFFRMVDTVLMRDRNWVVWKMAGCPPIQRDPIAPETFVDAKATAQKNATSKRLRPVPMGSVSLDFLRGIDDDGAMDSLKQRDRYAMPELDSFKRPIADDDFEIEMPTNEETKAAAVAGKSSKSWRALRIAGRYKMAMFDKIDDPKKINIIFEEAADVADDDEDDEPAAGEDQMPTNRDPIIISGPPGVGKSTLVGKLHELHKGVFASVIRHAVRDAAEGETDGKTFHFVKAPEFNQLRDGDRLVEHGTRDGVDYGTSTKAIDAVIESGKVPIIELDLEAAQFAKDMDFSARYILIKPPSSAETYIERLKSAGKDEGAAKAIAAESSSLPESAAETFDVMLDADEGVEERLSEFLFGKGDGDGGGDEKGEEEGKGDQMMEDAPVEAGEEGAAAAAEAAE
ncbi:THO complex subunit 1 transcription elongation factor domain-containing protein [Sarocladium implicatum]|nr:THO complex subunit 1 transcription elongation factor domain-containing protein [Sarocladium implicatum]